jgi:hypothetical protein
MLAFYRDHFIPRMPADLEFELISRTVGQNRVIDEEVLRFTHDVEMDWLLPGVAPTGRRVEAVFVVIVAFTPTARSNANTSTGIKPPCWYRSGSWIRRGFPSPASSPPARPSTSATARATS